MSLTTTVQVQSGDLQQAASRNALHAQASSIQNDSATYSNSQSFNNSCENLNPNSLGTGAQIDEKRSKKRQRKAEKTRKIQSKVIYKQQ